MVELIPKRGRKKVLPLQNIIFFASLLALLLTVGGYIFLFFSVNKASLDLKNIEGEVTQKGTAAEKQLESEVFDVQKRINNFSTIISQHQKISPLFLKIQENAHPQVWFNSFDLEAKTKILELRGQTLNFQTLAQQLSILRGESLFKEIKLSELSIGEKGQAEFSFNITLDPQIFK